MTRSCHLLSIARTDACIFASLVNYSEKIGPKQNVNKGKADFRF